MTAVYRGCGWYTSKGQGSWSAEALQQSYAAVTLDRMDLTAEALEALAFELYAAGPWGRFEGWRDDGARCVTDAHTMETYRAIVEFVCKEHDALAAAEPQVIPASGVTLRKFALAPRTTRIQFTAEQEEILREIDERSARRGEP